MKLPEYQNIEEGIKTLLRDKFDGKQFWPDFGIISYKSYNDLTDCLGAKVQYIDIEFSEDTLFTGIFFNGTTTILPDRNALDGEITFFYKQEKEHIQPISPITELSNSVLYKAIS